MPQVKRLLFILLALPLTLGAAQAEEQEAEALAVRRIVGFWKDGQYPIVRQQIHAFYDEYPNSKLADQLHVLLGDLELADGHAAKALEAYGRVQSKDMARECLSRKLQSLGQLKRWKEVLSQAKPLLAKIDSIEDPVIRQALLVAARALVERGQETDLGQAENICLAALEQEESPLAAALLAEIYNKQGREEKSLQLYQRLSERYPESKDNFLLQAAMLQRDKDPTQALKTFRQIQSGNSAVRADAAVQEFVLLVSLERLEELNHRHEALQRLLPRQQQTLLQFYTGRACFLAKQDPRATKLLQAFLTASTQDLPEQRQAALLMLIQSAERQHKGREAQELLAQLDLEFPDHQQRGKALLMVAQAFEKRGQLGQAIATLDRLLAGTEDPVEKELAAFLKASYLYRQKNLEEAHRAFAKFTECHPDSSRCQAAEQYLPTISLQLLQKDPENQGLRRQAITDIQRVLVQADTLSLDLRENYRFNLARLQMGFEDYRAAISTLDELINTVKTKQSRSQAHYLLAICHYEGASDLHSFAFHAEQALQKGKIAQRILLKRNLFTAYLQLYRDCEHVDQDDSTRNHYRDQAVHHLLDLVAEVPNQVDASSIQWLATVLYEKVSHGRHPYLVEAILDEPSQALADQAIDIHRKVLGLSANQRDLKIAENSLPLEREAVRLASLLGWREKLGQQKQLLEQLRTLQDQQPSWQWRYRPQVAFALAYSYELSRKWDQAYEGFRKLQEERLLRDPQLAAANQLHLARSWYQRMRKSERQDGKGEIDQVLELLKQLKTRRVLAQEPVHLEAAIDAAEIQATLYEKAEQDQELLRILRELKEVFTAEDDLWSRDYHSARQQDPEQDQIYQAYLMLIDAKIAYLQIRTDQAATHQEKERRKEGALTILSTLLDTRFAVSHYVTSHAKSSLDAMEQEAPLAIPEFTRDNRAYY